MEQYMKLKHSVSPFYGNHDIDNLRLRTRLYLSDDFVSDKLQDVIKTQMTNTWMQKTSQLINRFWKFKIS